MDSGPDQILSADCLTTTQPDGCVKLRNQTENDPLSPLSVVSLMKRTVDQYGDQIALRVKRNDEWLEWSYQQYWDEAKIVAKAFIKLGLKRHHSGTCPDLEWFQQNNAVLFISVCILGFNSPEWFLAQLGAIMAGAFSAGIYTTNNPEACKYIIEHCRADILVAEDTRQFDKFPKIKEFLPNVQCAVQYTGSPNQEGILDWTQLLEIGRNESDDEIDQRLKQIAINQCCVLVYTSGTTGPPKGVMMSHDNLTWMARTTCRYLGVTSNDSLVSYLPLSHSAAQMVGKYF